MRDHSTVIARALTEAYGSMGRKLVPTATSSLIEDLARIIRIYAEDMTVRPLEVISTDICRIVLGRVHGARLLPNSG